MRKYNMLQAVVMSFFSKSLYQDIVRNWGGIVFLYLFLLLLITWVPQTFVIKGAIIHFTNTKISSIVSQLPTITVNAGKASIDRPVPYFIHYSDSQKIFAVIDTSGQLKSLDQTSADVLLTKNKLFIRNHKNNIKEYPLQDIDNLVLTQKSARAFIKNIKEKGAWLLYPFLVIGSFLYRISQVLIYAAIGLFLFAKLLKVKLMYSQVLRLAIIAITPVIILSTVLDYFRVNFQYQLFLYFMISMIYLYFAVKSNRVGVKTEEEVQ